jgi:hypothetical protein
LPLQHLISQRCLKLIVGLISQNLTNFGLKQLFLAFIKWTTRLWVLKFNWFCKTLFAYHMIAILKINYFCEVLKIFETVCTWNTFIYGLIIRNGWYFH